MCNILQKDYSFTPPRPPLTHTHSHCHWSIALLHPLTPPHPVSNLSFAILIFNLIGWFLMMGAPPPPPSLPPPPPKWRFNQPIGSLICSLRNSQNVELRWDWPINFKRQKKGRNKSYRSDWIVVV